MTSPERIGPYQVERLLGAGSFATVWLARDPTLDSPVAIKVLADNWHHDLRVRERFVDEARLLRQLDDERLVRVHGVGELPDGRPYSVMTLADGGSLRDRLAAGPPPVPAAVDLLAEVAAGVAVLHRHGVVHRDLTPGNILFRSHPDGERVLVADLGLAKALAAASGLTARAGTPGYMAPEQDDPFAVVNTRADVYGLGRLGVRLLGPAGPPDRPPTGADRWRTGVPPAVAAVLRRATATDPADRYPDAEAFRVALRRAADPRPADATRGDGADPDGSPDPARARPTGRRWWAATGAGVAGLVALGTLTGDTPPAGRATDTWTNGAITVALPAGWRAVGTGWAGQYGADGTLEPALVMSPEPHRWAADPTVPGAFVGLSTSIAARTTPAGFVAERPHAACVPAPLRRVRRADVDWVVAGFTCARGRPVVVEAAGFGPDRTGLLYVQVVPPAGSDTGFVDRLLAGVRVG